ncbi:transporter associated domain-containing protein [Halalkalibacterium ligniniphilum]
MKLVKLLDPSTYIFYADYSIDEFARFTNVEIPDISYHTLGGWGR